MNEQHLSKRFHCDYTFFANPIKLANWKLVQVGELFLEPLSEVGCHDQVCNEISYVIFGEGFFEHNGVKTAVKEGDVIVSQNSGKHNIIASGNGGLFFAYVGFDSIKSKDLNLQQLEEFYSTEKPVFKSGADGLYNGFRHCLNEFNRESERNLLMIDACLTELLVNCYRVFMCDTTAEKYSLDAKKTGKSLYKIIKYIEGNIHKPISVSEVASAVGYSPCYLSHFFKGTMGITLQEYISGKRIEFAKEQMAIGKFAVTEISNRMGYLNLQSFSRSFKQKTGQTPTEFMRLLNGKNKEQK